MNKSGLEDIALQVDLVFFCASFYCTSQILCSLQIEGLLASSKSIGNIFPTALVHFMFLSHVAILTIF